MIQNDEERQTRFWYVVRRKTNKDTDRESIRKAAEQLRQARILFESRLSNREGVLSSNRE